MRKNTKNKVLASICTLALAFTCSGVNYQPNVVHAETQESDSSNILEDPGFEEGGAAWDFTEGTGVATNYPNSGSKLAYLDPSTEYKVSQTVTISEAGYYSLSGWIAVGGTGGIFGAKVNGEDEVSQTLTVNASYSNYVMNGIYLDEDDVVEVYVTGPDSVWINVDDFCLKSANLVQNPGFESGASDWEFVNGAGAATNNPYSGSGLAYLDAGTSNVIKQPITVPSDEGGTYVLRGWISSCAEGGVFSINVNDSTYTSTSISNTDSSYHEYIISDIELSGDDEVEICITGAELGWINVDDISLYEGEIEEEEVAEVVLSDDFTTLDDEWSSSASTCSWLSSSGVDDSAGCVQLSHSETTSTSKWTRTLELTPNKRYIASCYIKADNVAGDGDVGAYMNINGEYGVSADNLSDERGSGTKGTFDWKEVKFDFFTPDDGSVDLQLCLSGDMTGTVLFDNVQVVEDTAQIEMFESDHIKLYVAQDNLSAITTTKLNAWLDYLDTYYEKLAEITDYTPFDGEKIKIQPYCHDVGGWAVAGNPIKWRDNNNSILNELASINSDDDCSFGIMHEIGHTFDHASWNFQGEVWANFKVYLGLRTLGEGQVENSINSGASIWTSHDADELKTYMYTKADLSYDKVLAERDGLSVDSLVYCMIRMCDELDWSTFLPALTDTLSEIREVNIAYPCRDDILTNFLSVLQKHYNAGGTEIADTFPDGELDYIKETLTQVTNSVIYEDFSGATSVLNSNWSSNNDGTFTYSSSYGMDGTKGLRIVRDSAGFSRLTRTFHAEAGKWYKISGYVKGEDIVSTDESVGASITCNKNWQVAIGQNTTGTFDWTQLSLMYYAPTDHDVEINCSLGYYGIDAQGTAWFDNIQVAEVEETVFH